MNKLDEKCERGLTVIEEMLGPKPAAYMRKVATGDTFAVELARLALAYSYADGWGREGLARREKSIAVIAALVALRQPSELKNHVRLGCANGLTANDLEDLLIQLSSYVGFPCVSSARSVIVEVLHELGQEPDGKGAK